MNNRFIGTKYRTDCYNCKKSVDQIIEAVPYQARVTCSNCGATPVFVPRIEDVAMPGSFSKSGPYPVCLSGRSLMRQSAGTVIQPVPTISLLARDISPCSAEIAGLRISTNSISNLLQQMRRCSDFFLSMPEFSLPGSGKKENR